MVSFPISHRSCVWNHVTGNSLKVLCKLIELKTFYVDLFLWMSTEWIIMPNCNGQTDNTVVCAVVVIYTSISKTAFNVCWNIYLASNFFLGGGLLIWSSTETNLTIHHNHPNEGRAHLLCFCDFCDNLDQLFPATDKCGLLCFVLMCCSVLSVQAFLFWGRHICLFWAACAEWLSFKNTNSVVATFCKITLRNIILCSSSYLYF